MLTVAVALYAACAAQAATTLGEGKYHWTKWQTTTYKTYDFVMTVTGLPQMNISGGSIYLPIFSGVFSDRPNGHSPYWAIERAQGGVDGWEEVKCDKSESKDGASYSIKGMYEGLLLQNKILCADDTVTSTYSAKALMPNPSFEYYRLSLDINRAAKSDEIPFTATLADGKTVTGDLNKSFSKISDVKSLTYSTAKKTVSMEFSDCKGRLVLYSSNPEAVKAEAATVASAWLLPNTPTRRLNSGEELAMTAKIKVSDK
jgi:hypothetical protein